MMTTKPKLPFLKHGQAILNGDVVRITNVIVSPDQNTSGWYIVTDGTMVSMVSGSNLEELKGLSDGR